jgi:hexosaminidase
MKLNVLHWHMTDDESFPFLLEQYPEITRGGSYGIDEVYTAADVKAII